MGTEEEEEEEVVVVVKKRGFNGWIIYGGWLGLVLGDFSGHTSLFLYVHGFDC